MCGCQPAPASEVLGDQRGRVNQQAAIREFVMNLRRATTTGAALLALVVSAVPALAAASDQNGRDRRQGQAARVQPNNGGGTTRPQANNDPASGRQTRGASASEVRRDVAVPRAAPRVESNARVDNPQIAPRQTNVRQYNAPRQTDVRQGAARQTDVRQSAARQTNVRQSAPRQYDTRQAVPRQYDARPYDNRRYDNRGYAYGGAYRGYAYGGWAYGGWAYGGYGYGGYGYRPYIPRPGVRFGLGISIFAGSPYGFRFDYGWAAPYAYRFPMTQGIGYGGMSFLIDPDGAAVYVDGQFIGIARDFDGQPVPLAAGVHEIQLQAEGCEPVVFDIRVRPGQVIPYRGSLMLIR